MQTGPVPTLCMHYCWLLAVVFPVVFVLPLRIPKRTKIFTSHPPNAPWNPHSNPLVFLHMSDLHLSHRRQNSYSYLSQVLNWSLGKFKPDKVIICGDLTDNKGPQKVHPYRTQLENDWSLYAKLLQAHALTPENLIQNVGNHDVFGLKSYDERNNYARRYFTNFTNFRMSVEFFKHEGTTYKFVVLNQYDFPSGPITFLRWTFITSEFREALERELSKDDCDIAIIVSHSPALRHHKLGTFANILTKNTKLRIMLSGHWHPIHGATLHFGNTLEAVAPPLFKTPRIGLLTFDNLRHSYTVIDMRHDVNAILTHPVPDTLASDSNLFNEQNTEIRAIGFASDLNLEVRGSVNGRLRQTRKLKNGVYLYSLPMHLNPGKHFIVRSGDWNGTVEFTIGDKVNSFFETPYMNRSSYGWSMLFVWMYIPALFLVLPWSFPLRGNFVLMSFGFLKARVCELPRRFRVSLFIGTLVCVVFPICMFDVEGLLCAFHVAGCLFGHRYRYHYLGAKYGMTFLFGMFYPVVNSINGLEFYGSRREILLIDAVFVIYGIWRWLYDFSWLFDLFDSLYVAWSPIMTIVPVVLYGNLLMLCVDRFKRRGDESTEQLKNNALYSI